MEANNNDIDVSKDDDKYYCTVCGKKFRRLAYLKKHTSLHSVKMEPILQWHCPSFGNGDGAGGRKTELWRPAFW